MATSPSANVAVGPVPERVDGLRRDVAYACRILAARGLCEDILGHVSARVGAGHMLLRCRGADERGLLFTTPDDVRLVDLDSLDGTDPGGGYAHPNELAIHTELLNARPDAQAVVHAHPPNVVAADLAGVSLVAMVGAYNIPAAKLAAGGIPVYPRAGLVNDPDLGRDLAAVLGGRPAVILRGHGIATVGSTVEQAVATALALDSLAAMALRVKQAGTTPKPLPAGDLADLPDLGPGFNDTLLWRHHVARLERAGLGLP